MLIILNSLNNNEEGKKLEKGQFSIEFIIVLAVLIGLLGSITIPLYRNSRKDAQRTTNMSIARETANKLAGTLNNVYTAGVGNKQKITYTLPDNIDNIVISKNFGSSENRLEVQIRSNYWGNDNISVGTLLPTRHKNWPGYPLIKENLDTIEGEHEVVIEYKQPEERHENLLINLREV